MNQEYCPGCNLTVAPNDPEQTVFRGKVWHAAHLKRARLKESSGKEGKIVIRQELVLDRR